MEVNLREWAATFFRKLVLVFFFHLQAFISSVIMLNG